MNDLEQFLFLYSNLWLVLAGGWGRGEIREYSCGRGKQGSELKISMAEDVFIFMGGRFSFLIDAVKCCLQMLFES